MRQQLNDPNTLVAEVRNHVAFRERLLSEIPDLDEPTLADTLEGLTNVRELIAALLRSALDDQAIASGLSVRVSFHSRFAHPDE